MKCLIYSVLSLPALLFTDTYYVDFTNFPNSSIVENTHKDFFETGVKGFNSAPELNSFFLYLRDKFNIKACVETGTYLGDTSQAFSRIFESVDTIELNENFYKSSKERLKNISNISIHQGDSAQLLKAVSELNRDKFTLFYLDAHWNEDWPLLNEIQAISETHKNNCILVIDDFKVPNRPEIYYDFYNNKECSFDYIQEKLTLVFDDYDIIYLIPRNIDSRAKFIALPKG